MQTDASDSNSTEALAMIARLPLSDAEQAEAVRRLLVASDPEPRDGER